MSKKPVDGLEIKKLVEAGLAWLRVNHQMVNALNVFPVPDGDTGTNMLLTMQAAYNEVANTAHYGAGQMAAAVAQGALMGARGNSGVILSQIWRGFARGLHGIDLVDARAMAQAFAQARDTAYKGVVRPVEGTILTVAKDVAIAAENALGKTESLSEMLRIVVAAADESVQRTPELLPVLKQAGVVDSGGKGLFFILEGMLRLVDGLPLDSPLVSVQPLSAMNLENAMSEVEEGQDWEVVVDFRPNNGFELQTFYTKLEEMGTSIQVGEGEGMYRMHIHTLLEKRYEPIDYIMGLGTITKVAMENLLAQMDAIGSQASATQIELANVEPGQIAVVTVSPGNGLSRIFASLGVTSIVAGGQTMNPSTKDILEAFENLPTDKVIILPNNKNIILAANQAKEVTVKQVQVVPSRNVPQGLAAMLHLNPDGDLDKIAERMTQSLDTIVAGEVTVAVRTVEIDGVSVQEGQAIALMNGKLAVSAESVEEAVMQLLEKAHAQDYELIALFYGEEMRHPEANRIADRIREKYPNQEIEVQEGGQPHYHFIISIE
ncbi:MAG: DAK2 domain-containing protein [Anaerolineales bacterium]|jgi:DAK2 domain fusion protein YloV|nr:DAK2 domain-containing protein [Anaerolineales bacterium]